MFNEKKLKEIVNILYTKELLGLNIFDNIDQYPQLITECDKLAVLAFNYEVEVINKQITTSRKSLEETIININTIASSIPTYRQSQIFFDDAGNFTGLF
jgi:hypothetical protein